MRFIFLLLALLVHLPAATSDVTLTLTGVTNVGTISYAWSVIARPEGSVLPTFTFATTTTGSNKAIFDHNAIPGTYLIQARLTAGDAPPLQVQTPVQVTARQTTTFPTGGATITYTPGASSDFNPGATTTAPGLGVVYTIVSGPATVVGGMIRPTGTGTVVVKADVEPHSPVRYRSSATAVTKSFTIVSPALTPQTITAGTTTLNLVKGTTPRTESISATTTSGLPLSYTTSNPSVATVSSTGLVTAIAPGMAIITVSQAGDSTFAPATPVIVQVNVIAALITITVPLVASPATLDLP